MMIQLYFEDVLIWNKNKVREKLKSKHFEFVK